MIALFTDFGPGDMYVGQMHAVLAQRVPRVPVIDLMHNAPRNNTLASAHLLAALSDFLPGDTVLIAVVDPGVGGERDPLMIKNGDRWLLGPDNGLLDVAGGGESNEWFRIDWRPEKLSQTFHGRDLFAPVAAMLAEGHLPVASRIENPGKSPNDTGDLFEIIYIDHYGNAITGLYASEYSDDTVFKLGNRSIAYAPHYENAPRDKLFWYRNSIGLVEFAVALDSAGERCKLAVGNKFSEAPGKARKKG
jgi:S-adenosylmethionine hydrolase